MSSPAVLTIPEVAELLQVSRLRAYQLAREGRLPVLRLGRQIRVPKRAFEEMLAGRTAAALQ